MTADNGAHLLRKNSIFGYGTIGYNDIAKHVSESNGKSCWYLSGVNSEISGIFFARAVCSPYTNEEKGLIIFEPSRKALNNIAALFTGTVVKFFTYLLKDKIIAFL